MHIPKGLPPVASLLSAPGRAGVPSAASVAQGVADSVQLGIAATPSGVANTTRAPAAVPLLQVTPDRAQIQVSLEGKPLMAPSSELGFLGEAARTIGDGARWKHPFPQEWPWPPTEPDKLSIERRQGETHIQVTDPKFIQRYGALTGAKVSVGGQGEVRLGSQLANLTEKPQSPWIVAPLATPPGSTLDDPASMVVFPVFKAEELAQLNVAGEQAQKAWDYQADSGLMFVSPGARLEDNQAKGLFSDRWSLFGRKGDSSVLICQARGAAEGFGFQVYAGIGNYLELEWAGKGVGRGEVSEVEVELKPVKLADLQLELDGKPLERLGQSGAPLKAELAAVTRALRQRLDEKPLLRPDDAPGWLMPT